MRYQGICVAILNPELESYTAVRGADCKPLLLSDFSSVFHLNTDAYVSATIHTSKHHTQLRELVVPVRPTCFLIAKY
jgi:hypothetical protein